jgi:hypothetical protein
MNEQKQGILRTREGPLARDDLFIKTGPDCFLNSSSNDGLLPALITIKQRRKKSFQIKE